MRYLRSLQAGFGAIAAIVILVILALLASSIVTLSSVQQMTLAEDALSARAWQAARAGNEWGLFKALRVQPWSRSATPETCDSGPRSATLDLVVQTGFHVTVTCDSWQYNEGESSPGVPRTIRIYRIRAVACRSAVCPDNVAASRADYVERTREVIATD